MQLDELLITPKWTVSDLAENKNIYHQLILLLSIANQLISIKNINLVKSGQ